MRARVLSIMAVIATIFVIGSARSAAQPCPARPPGYWSQQLCTGANVPTPAGPCLIIVCYCAHRGNPMIPGDIDEMFIYGMRPGVPGCMIPNPDINYIHAAMEALVQLDCHGDLEQGEGGPCSGEKDITVSHAFCMHNVGQGTNYTWAGCSNSGECSITYRVRCADCVIEKQINSSSTGGCDDYSEGNKDCVIVCD
jgi:hypothetical protein